MSRVIVAMADGARHILGVFDSWDAYDEWQEHSDWDEDDVDTYDCNVRQS